MNKITFEDGKELEIINLVRNTPVNYSQITICELEDNSYLIRLVNLQDNTLHQDLVLTKEQFSMLNFLCFQFTENRDEEFGTIVLKTIENTEDFKVEFYNNDKDEKQIR